MHLCQGRLDHSDEMVFFFFLLLVEKILLFRVLHEDEENSLSTELPQGAYLETTKATSMLQFPLNAADPLSLETRAQPACCRC